MCPTEREDVSTNGSENDGETFPLAPPELLNVLLSSGKKQGASRIKEGMERETTGLRFEMKCSSN